MISQHDNGERAGLAVRGARSAFTPKVVPNVRGSFGQTNVSDQSYRLDLSQRFVNGTEVRLGTGTSTAQVPAIAGGEDIRFYNTDTTLLVSQPLLKGFGAGVTPAEPDAGRIAAGRRGPAAEDRRAADRGRSGGRVLPGGRAGHDDHRGAARFRSRAAAARRVRSEARRGSRLAARRPAGAAARVAGGDAAVRRGKRGRRRARPAAVPHRRRRRRAVRRHPRHPENRRGRLRRAGRDAGAVESPRSAGRDRRSGRRGSRHRATRATSCGRSSISTWR